MYKDRSKWPIKNAGLEKIYPAFLFANQLHFDFCESKPAMGAKLWGKVL